MSRRKLESEEKVLLWLVGSVATGAAIAVAVITHLVAG